MSEQRHRTTHRTDGPWVIDTRELGRRPGHSRAVNKAVPVTADLGLPEVIAVPAGAQVQLDVLLESVVEGVLVTGSATAPIHGECSRCLDEIDDELTVGLTELFAYPDSTTEATTEDDEVGHLVNDKIDLEPLVRDAVVLALPQAPLCEPDCQGLCPQCGGKWADLGPKHEHETIDPRWAALKERFSEARDETEEN